MRRVIIVSGLLIVSAIILGVIVTSGNNPFTENADNTLCGSQPTSNTATNNETNYQSLSHEEAEQTAFKFMEDVIAAAPPTNDEAAAQRLYNTLSRSAKTAVNRSIVSHDIANFVLIQQVPDQGVSVEDIQVVSPQELYVILGLNYSVGFTTRNIHL